jgi:hypothetical protein
MVDKLDAALVLVCLAILAGVLAVLSFVKVPQENLPILSGLTSSVITGVIMGYAGYRWGASVSKQSPAASPAGTVTATLSATADVPAEPGAPS